MSNMNNMSNVSVIQTNNRILLKTILYRVITIIISFIISNAFFKNIKKALFLTIIIELIQMINYCFYEIIWNNIKWGIEFKIENENISKPK
jgi:uncharacterized membrane protein